MLTATAIFLGLYRIKVSPKVGKVLAWLAGGVFEGYLLSKIFDLWTYPLVKQWHVPEKFWLVFICITLPTFVCTLLLGKLVNTLSVSIQKLFTVYSGKVPVKKK